MKKKLLPILMLVIIAIFLTQQASAKIWRVNNLSNYNLANSIWGDNLGGTFTNPVFAQLADINTSNLVSQNGGDTIHVEGSSVAYNSVNLAKKVVIIGPGFFLNENINVSANALEAKISDVQFFTGSDSSQLIGLHISGSNGITWIDHVSNILIKRCKIDHIISPTYNNTNITIIQNYFTNINNTQTSIIFCSAISFPTNFVFNNNICKGPLLINNSAGTYTMQQCNNNIFDCPVVSGGPTIRFYSGECRNNIIKSAGVIVDVNGSNTNFTNNSSAATSQLLGTAASNVNAADINTMFVASGTTDGKYKLNPASADNIPGYDGTERGVFGGSAISNQYTLSGLAPIPVIYSIQTSGVSGASGLPITIKARIIN